METQTLEEIIKLSTGTIAVASGFIGLIKLVTNKIVKRPFRSAQKTEAFFKQKLSGLLLAKHHVPDRSEAIDAMIDAKVFSFLFSYSARKQERDETYKLLQNDTLSEAEVRESGPFMSIDKANGLLCIKLWPLVIIYYGTFFLLALFCFGATIGFATYGSRIPEAALATKIVFAVVSIGFMILGMMSLSKASDSLFIRSLKRKLARQSQPRTFEPSTPTTNAQVTANSAAATP